MGERDRYSEGTFSWAELSTPDPATATRFYGQLFGWEYEEFPMGEGAMYNMASLHGRHVGAIAPQPQQQQEAGVPSHWGSYITVESADRSLERAAQLGGQVHAGPFDVFDSGRMGVVRDPHGAIFMVWEPRSHIGAGLVNVAGALTWNELATPDPTGVTDFYGQLFGWTFQRLEASEMDYLVVQRPDGHSNGGIRGLANGETLPYWLVYFGTDDLEATLERVNVVGGGQLTGPMPIGPGRIAIARDPLGAVFALYQGQFDD